jgi:hypothetical protein
MATIQEELDAFRKSLREQAPVYDEEAVRRQIQQDVEQLQR